MPSFSLSRKAAEDVAAIADYTIQAFGIKQARRYRTGLKTALRTLSRNPSLGRPAEEFAPGLRRFEYQSHIIFYRKDENGIFVLRVLHKKMDVEKHL